MILDEFHLLQPAAAAKLLKTIEEPPASTIFVVIAEQLTPELVTIASRCVRVDFRPLSDEAIFAELERRGVGIADARAAARSSGGSLDRALLLANDPTLSERRDAFASAPRRLDGTGRVALQIVDELLGAIDAAAEPLKTRHTGELATLEERVAAGGERGSGRKAIEERQKRELRRHRTDELKSGLAVLAGSYRDALAQGEAHHAPSLVQAVHDVHAAIEALERNPNESLLLQALLLRLPSLAPA
jgi:DNA polymerase-3 subunit delta'